MTVVAEGNLFSFFYDRVKAAQDPEQRPLDESTEFYLVNLLCEFRHSRALLEQDGRRVDERAWAIRLLEGRQAPPTQRWSQLKQLGDSMLYLLGLFSESLRRRAVGLRYYETLGRAAYDDLSQLGGAHRGGGHTTFADLHARFDRCVEVLGEAGEDETKSDRDILHLYEQWTDLGSTRAHRRLLGLGIVAMPAPRSGPQ